MTIKHEVVTCPECGGRGFIELEHGLIQKKCPTCHGQGKVRQVIEEDDTSYVSDSTDYVPDFEEVIPKIEDEVIADDIVSGEELPSESVTGNPPIPPEDTDPGVVIKEGGIDNTSDSGVEPDNKPDGSRPSSKSKRSGKSKARKNH